MLRKGVFVFKKNILKRISFDLARPSGLVVKVQQERMDRQPGPSTALWDASQAALASGIDEELDHSSQPILA